MPNLQKKSPINLNKSKLSAQNPQSTVHFLGMFCWIFKNYIKYFNNFVFVFLYTLHTTHTLYLSLSLLKVKKKVF